MQALVGIVSVFWCRQWGQVTVDVRTVMQGILGFTHGRVYRAWWARQKEGPAPSSRASSRGRGTALTVGRLSVGADVGADPWQPPGFGVVARLTASPPIPIISACARGARGSARRTESTPPNWITARLSPCWPACGPLALSMEVV